MKAWVARFWPVMRLRTILFGTLLFVAALPGFGAVFLRVYENALVRRTEAELVAQTAALGASAAQVWAVPQPLSSQASAPASRATDLNLSPYPSDEIVTTEIDLGATPILEERPAPQPARMAPVPEALVAARVMAPAIAETRSVTLASIILLDSNGTILSGAWQGQSLAEVPEVAEALGGIASTRLRRNASYKARTMLEVFSRAATIRLHHARPVLVSGRVVGVVLASRSPRALMRGLYEDRGKIALGTGLIFVVLTGLSLILARTIVRPIEALSAASRALASGTRATPQRSALNVVEIATLFDDFEAMSASIERRSAYLRDFAAAVSHEFKTPIAALHGTIEILDDHGPVMDDTQRRQFLDNMRQDTGRLSRLVSRLLDLARADMQAVDRDVRCDVADACRSVATQCSTRAMAVSCQLPDGPVLARIDQGVLEAVLVTLADNAAQAGADRFQLTLTADAGQVLILATNSGPAIPEADRERIFEPFFTSRRAEGGTGMGLAIARSLLGGYHATLTLEQPDRPPAGRVADMPVAFLLSLAAVQSD